MAVTTQDRSPAVLSRFMRRQHTCSVTSAVATHTRTSSGAPRPYINTEATSLGKSDRHTMPMIHCVEPLPWK